MGAPLFEIGADGVDAEQVVREIRAAVERKAGEGVYRDARVARAERTNLIHFKNDGEFLDFYIAALREAAFVDINDFEIRERRGGLPGRLLVKLKRTIWVLLKFYTYRLWSQQNLINGLFVTGIESLGEKSEARIRALEARVAELEKRLAAQDKP